MTQNHYASCFDVLQEPRGSVYRQLLAFAVTRCTTFSLVWQDDNPELAVWYEKLLPFCLNEASVSEWPGTHLVGGTAKGVTCQLNQDSVKHLASVGGLYAWRHPRCPEDLATYTLEGVCWLGSIAHEHDAFLNAEVVSGEDLVRWVPGLRTSLRSVA